MKNLKLSFIVLMVLGMAACKKSNAPIMANQENTTDVAADLAVNSLSINSAGAIGNLNDVTYSANAKIKIDSACSTVWKDSVSRNINVGSGYSYNYKANYIYELGCTTNLFNGSVTTTSTYTSSYIGPNLATSSSGSSDFTISGLRNPAGVVVSGQYTINGDYKRSGSFQSKIDSTYNGTHNTDIVITNLKISKLLPTIDSGSATITITGNMPKRGAFSYTGTIVFNGGNKATLTLNGTVYILDLLTGQRTRA